MDRTTVMAATKEVTAQLEVAQEMFRKGQSELCLAYLETIIAPGLVYWYALITVMCQKIVLDTPACGCVRHGGEQCFRVDVIDGRTGRRVTDPLYPFSTEIITVFSRDDWHGYTDRLQHVLKEDQDLALLAMLFGRLTQLQDARATGHL